MSATDPDPQAATPDEAAQARVTALEAEVAALRAEVVRLTLLADHDTLTSALNRRAFARELSRTLAYCRRYGASAAVLYLDLDGFKAVNDRFGHPVGDETLKRIAELLKSQVRESDTVARLGGDEFGVLLQQVTLETAQAKAAALADAIAREPFTADGQPFRLGGSFGVRAYDDHTDAEAWLAEADAAMFVRKRAR